MMFQHAWRVIVFVYALGEAFTLADTAGSILWAPVDLVLATAFTGCAAWNFCLAIRAVFVFAHRPPSNINDAELNDGLSEENAA